MENTTNNARTTSLFTRLLVTAALLLPFANTNAMELTYTHTDAQGSVIVVTNQAGEIIEERVYEPYGLPTGTIANSPGYTGHLHDSDTGLIYMQQRYYDPVVRRFLSVDPVLVNTNDGTNFNRYWYANNNPYRYVDPDGEFAGLAIKAIKVIAKGGDVAATMAGAISDAKTVMDPNASLGDRVMAGASLVSEIASPISLRDAKAGAAALSKLGKKSCCFVAGTQVLTREGYKNIEDVKLGEELWAKNTDTGEQDWKPVTKVFIEPGRGIYEIVLNDDQGNAQKIEATDDHPFWVEGKGWKTTIELEPGDAIETDGDVPMTVTSVTDEQREDVTYNFTVADFHTYYVTERGVLVHNCGDVDGAATKVGDVTTPGAGTPNISADISKADFEKNLTDSGYTATQSGDGKVMNYTKGDKRYSVRDSSKSTGGPTAETFKDDKIVTKIRLNDGSGGE